MKASFCKKNKQNKYAALQHALQAGSHATSRLPLIAAAAMRCMHNKIKQATTIVTTFCCLQHADKIKLPRYQLHMQRVAQRPERRRQPLLLAVRVIGSTFN